MEPIDAGAEIDSGADSGRADACAERDSGVSGTAVSVTAHPTSPGHVIASDFIGLSYETSALIQTTPGNQLDPIDPVTRQLMKNLAPSSLRFGGNSVDTLCGWTREVRTASTDTCKLTSTEIDAGVSLARAVGYQILWSIDLESGDAGLDADQVAYLYGAASDVVQQIAIGNEPNLYGWTTAAFLSSWLGFKSAIVPEIPGARFAGWDATQGGLGNWTPKVADSLGDGIQLLTSHFYALEGISSPTSLDLLSPDMVGKEQSKASQLLQLAQSHSIPSWRMSETGAGNGGSVPSSISNTFAAALWAVDYMFLMAQYQAAGVNFHCGRGGAFPPGPLQEIKGAIQAQPVYFGLLLFRQAAKGQWVPLDLTTHGLNLTTYGTVDSSGTLRITVINKDPSNAAVLTIAPGAKFKTVQSMRLTAPSVSSTDGILLAGASIASDGTWFPTKIESEPMTNESFTTDVPAASAVLVTFAD